MRWLPNFYDFRFKSTATAGIAIHLLKPDCYSWWISKMQSGREDTLQERYAIKFCFELGRNAATERYGMLQTSYGASCMNRASVFEWHKDSRKAGSVWGMMRGVGGVRVKRLLLRGLEFHVCTINKIAHRKKVWKRKKKAMVFDRKIKTRNVRWSIVNLY